MTPTRLLYKMDSHLKPVSTMLLLPTLFTLLCLLQPLVFTAAASLTALVPRKALANPGDRIVGGQPADISDFPYQLSLREYFRHVCGASIISSTYAISAAHCVYQRTTFCEKVIAGSSDLNDIFHSRWHKVKKNNVHPLFNPETIDYDVSVLRVWPEFHLGNRLSAVSLPVVNFSTPENTSVVVSGWGTQSEGSQSVSHRLQYTTVQIVDFDSCNSAYEGMLTPRMLCASSPGRDACQGDSGGPMVLRNGVVSTLIGIVSFGRGCAEMGYPGVYTNVSDMDIRTYIQQIAGV